MFVLTPEQALMIKRGEATHEELDNPLHNGATAFFNDGLETINEEDDPNAESVTADMTHAEKVLRRSGLRKADDYEDKMMDLMIQLHDITGKMIKLHIERTTAGDRIKH